MVDHLEIAELDQVELHPAPDELAHVGSDVRAPEAHLGMVGEIGRWAPVDQKRRAVPALEQQMVRIVSGDRVRPTCCA